MVLTLEYPDNWTEIAAAIKQAAGYRCNRCGLKCLPSNDSYRHLDLSLRRKLSAQVHHIDGNPARNDGANLVCLCSGCHLRMHRHRPQPTPGQLSLKLKLPKVRRVHQKHSNFQLTLADLIDRLPQLPLTLHRQLELDLSTRDSCFTTKDRDKYNQKTRSIAHLIPVGQRCPTLKRSMLKAIEMAAEARNV
jgi:5-methylcytosine-specific restriction endonuclease McrA